MMEACRPWCKNAFGHTDAAKRVSDEWNMHRAAAPHDSIGKWFAAALHDGRSDHALYDSKSDAIRHMGHNEQFFAFFKLNPATMTPCEAEVMLKVHRTAYDNGMRLTDPDDKHGGKDFIVRSSAEDMRSFARGVTSNLIIPGKGKW